MCAFNLKTAIQPQRTQRTQRDFGFSFAVPLLISLRELRDLCG